MAGSADGTGSREAILAAVRRAASGAGPAPDPTIRALRYDDPAAQFATALAAAGGECRELPPSASLGDALRELPAIAGARRIVSEVAELASVHPAGEPVAPTDLADLDVAILPGTLAVAESAAVWVEPRDALFRAALFLAEHLVLVVSEGSLVHDLHAAYERVAPRRAAFGCFVAGPSKTADIEQALVIGAHGPRSCTVLLRREAEG
ncbi:MAG: LUD domain-containing protein [Myxococcota bacterium]|nr:LUD domain-containing protein [Myxococcota bacterium]